MFAEDLFYEQRALRDQTNYPQTHRVATQRNRIKDFLNQIDQQNNSQDEGIQDYKIGGYHPVHIGQVLINRYVVIQKLGWGHFSTVWLCKDFKHKTYVAIKIQKSSSNYMEAAFDQVEILQKIQTMIHSPKWQGKNRQDNHVVGLLNAFIYKSAYGNHFCMVFQVLRCNLLDVIKQYNYEGIPIEICQQISRQVLQGLDYLHRVCGVIHTDLKPQNVMIGLSKQQLQQIVDTGRLQSNQLFYQRIRLFQQYMGIKNNQEIQKKCNNLPNNQKILNLKQKLNSQNLSRNQKKNLKKKIKKQQKKGKNEQNLQNTPQINQYHNQKSNNSNPLDIFNVHKGKIQINKKNKLKLPLKVKIADLGNACWKHHHFSTLIQTRQYRSPEVILGQTYNQSADIWSLACMMYEVLTGDLLFQPKKGEQWSKNDDHLAQMQELVGPFDLNFIARSPKSRKYFNKNGTMKRFPSLNHYSISTVLQLKNKIKQKQAKNFANFLIPMLIPQPEKRIKSVQALKHQWLSIQKFQDPCKMSQQQHQQLKQMFCQNQCLFRQPIKKKDDEEASCEDNKNLLQQKKQNSRKKDYKFADIRYLDRSFTDLGYVGYCDGIDFDQLDANTNWQFN